VRASSSPRQASAAACPIVAAAPWRESRFALSSGAVRVQAASQVYLVEAHATRTQELGGERDALLAALAGSSQRSSEASEIMRARSPGPAARIARGSAGGSPYRRDVRQGATKSGGALLRRHRGHQRLDPLQVIPDPGIAQQRMGERELRRGCRALVEEAAHARTVGGPSAPVPLTRVMPLREKAESRRESWAPLPKLAPPPNRNSG
jgi:hypothetical protein